MLRTNRLLFTLFTLVIAFWAQNGHAADGPTPATGGDGTYVDPDPSGKLVDGSSGHSRYNYEFEAPASRGNVRPALALVYRQTSNGGDAGASWTLSLPSIERTRGMWQPLPPSGNTTYPFPRRTAAEERFTFGGAPLVEICTLVNLRCAAAPDEVFGGVPEASRYYRLQVEGAFIRFFRLPGDGTWIAQHKSGIVEEYGTPQTFGARISSGSPVEFDTEDPTTPTAYRWNLSRRYSHHRDSAGNPLNIALFSWASLGARGLSYLRDVFDTPDPSAPTNISRFAHHVEFAWGGPDYPVRSAAVAWRRTKEMRIEHVDVSTHPFSGPAAAREQVRRYWLTYYPQPTNGNYTKGVHAPIRNRSFLKSIQVEGRCAAPPTEIDPTGGHPSLPSTTGCGLLPPLTFSYTPRTLPWSTRVPFVEPGPNTFTNTGNLYFHKDSGDYPERLHVVVPNQTSFADIDHDGYPDLIAHQDWKMPGASTTSADMRAFLNIPDAYGLEPKMQMICANETPGVPAGGAGFFMRASTNVVGYWGTQTGRGDFWRYNKTSANWNWARLDISQSPSSVPGGATCAPSAGVWSTAVQFRGATWTETGSQTSPTITGSDASRFAADFDGDGLVDMMAQAPSNASPLPNQQWVNFTRRSPNGGQGFIAPFQEKVRSNIVYGTEVFPQIPELSFPDLDGDGIPDVLFNLWDSANSKYLREIAFDGRGTGVFRCDDAGCTHPVAAVKNDSGFPMSGRYLESAGGPLWGPQTDYGAFAFHDINGDGLADAVGVRYTDLASFGYSGAYGRSVSVSIWINEDGVRFRRLCSQDPTGAACSNSTDEKFVEVTPDIGTGPVALRFADINANGTDDIVVVTTKQMYWIDQYGRNDPADLINERLPPGLLQTVDNGLGATTKYSYDSLQALHQSTWANPSPQVSFVVTKIRTKTNLPDPYSSNYGADFTYEDPRYDPWRQGLVGFRRVFESRGSKNIETEYAMSACQSFPNGCIDSSDNDPDLATTAQPIHRVIRNYDRSKVLSERVWLRDHRVLFSTPNRNVYFDPILTDDTFLFDTENPGAPTPVTVTYLEHAGWQNETERTVTFTRGGSNGERIQRTFLHDNQGNVTEKADRGRVEWSTAADIDEVYIVKSAVSAKVNGWTFRVDSQTLEGSWNAATPHEAQYTYDANGDRIDDIGVLRDTIGLDRAHVSGQPIAPLPNGISADGPKVLAHLTRASTGSVTGVRGESVPTPNGWVQPCKQFSHDFYQQYVIKEFDYRDGCGTPMFQSSSYSYDRGFGVVVATQSTQGLTDMASYDQFGRLENSYRGDLAAPGGVDPTPISIISYETTVGGPIQKIRTRTRVSDGTYAEKFTYFDGLGQAILDVKAADISAGDAAPWIVSGLTIRNTIGQPTKGYRPFFYSGDPRTVPIVAPKPTPDADWNYDEFSRLSYTHHAGVFDHHYRYLPLFTEEQDAEQSTPASPHFGATSSEIRDGHNRVVIETVSWKRSGGTDEVSVFQAYDPAGNVTYFDRRHSDTSATDVPPNYARYFAFDTLNRLQWSTEPNSTGARLWRYAYNDAGWLIGTSDPRGCGANFYYDGLGRSVAKDVSPCEDSHEPYSAIDTTTGDGAEVFNVYDTAEAGEDPTQYGNAFALYGQLSASYTRGAHTRFGYDSRGNESVTSRRIVKPGAPTAVLADRYTPHWYKTETQYDLANRESAVSTGADAPELLVAGASQIFMSYSARGALKKVDSSYGPLAASLTWEADGLPKGAVYGDAAATTANYTYDAKRRTTRFDVRRTAPAFWSAAPNAYYTPPTSSPPTTRQTVLADLNYSYDLVGNITQIRDEALYGEWPAGAKPAKRDYTYDSLYRVVGVASSYRTGTGGSAWGNDTQVSPDAAEVAAGNTRPVPRRTLAQRARSHSIAYDWLGNTTSIDDDQTATFDRSLGTIQNGRPDTDGVYGAIAPNQLTSAGAGGAVQVQYDDAGNVADVLVKRTGTCATGKCIQRFSYRWDEEGQLASASRWDYATLPGSEPLYPQFPSRAPDWKDTYQYDGGRRVLKTATSAAGAQSHTLEVFGTLRLNRTNFVGGDYGRTASVEVAQLGGFGRVVYAASGMPIRDASGLRHVFLTVGDHQGSTSIVIDKATSELVERVTYDAWGRTESDYRPARWAGAREDLRFTGKEEDVEVGATYFGGRYYSPYLGRWLSPDPLAIAQGGGDLNPYAYVAGGLINSIDPDGFEVMEIGRSVECGVQGHGGGEPDGAHGSESLSPLPGAAGEGYANGPDAGELPTTRPISAPGPTWGAADIAQDEIEFFEEMKKAEANYLIDRISACLFGCTPLEHADRSGAIDFRPEFVKDFVHEELQFPLNEGRGNFAKGYGTFMGQADEAAIGWAVGRLGGGGGKGGGAKGGGGVCSGGKCDSCFVAGTPVMTVSERVPIESIRVGDRVHTVNESDCAHESGQLEQIDLALESPRRGTVTLLRPRSWIRDLGLSVGVVFSLSTPEFGRAEARVQRIVSRLVEGGTGCLVTGTIAHPAQLIVDLEFSTGEVVHTTPPHPFYVTEVSSFVPAGQLVPGQHVRTLEGSAPVVRSTSIRSELTDVFNLEVEGAHTYVVGYDDIWVHNDCPEAGDIVRGGSKAPGFEKHHGVMGAWARRNIPGYKDGSAPAMLLRAAAHNLTRALFNRFRGGRKIDWKNMSPVVAQQLAYDMFRAAGASEEDIGNYFRAFNIYIYGIK